MFSIFYFLLFNFITDFYGFAILYKDELRLLKQMKNKNRKKNNNMKGFEEQNDRNEISIKLNNC